MAKSASPPLIDEFAGKLEGELKSDKFSSYGSGSEIPFIENTVDLLDGTYAYDGHQILNVKCKMAHGSPMVDYPASSNNPTKVELADFLFVFNFWENGSVEHRQAFFSQSKCMKDKKPGYLWWEIDQSQYELYRDRPDFELEHNSAVRVHDLRECPDTFLNYSFASDIHRPFFYKARDMDEYTDYGYATPRFHYGQNPPSSNRYLLSVLKSTLRGRYGSGFSLGTPEFELIEEVYDNASLKRSDTSNSLPFRPDGGENQDSFAIINVDVDTDGWLHDFDTGLIQALRNEEEYGEREMDVSQRLYGNFSELDKEGLDFDRV